MTTPDPNLETKKEVDLGLETSVTEFPFPVTIEEEEYFLAQSKDGVYRLLSATCPHSWGKIVTGSGQQVAPFVTPTLLFYTGNGSHGTPYLYAVNKAKGNRLGQVERY